MADKTISSLLENYFNLYNQKLEIISKELKIRKFSSHKIFISKSEFKHTNNKIIINIYIYNRQKINYLNLLKNNFIEKNFINIKSVHVLKQKAKYINNLNNKLNYMYNLINNKDNFLIYKNIYTNEYLKTCINRQILYLYYKRLLLFNQLKLRYVYLQYIINVIKKIYNKNIELNIINLKYFYLNSDIFTKSIINKITKNRTKVNNLFKTAIQKVKIVNNIKMFRNEEKKNFNLLNIINTIDKRKIKSYLFKNSLNKLILRIYQQYSLKTNRKIIFDRINNKYITGIRLEASGRLSRRFTASRSLSKLKYKGSLRNRNSSYKGLSSIIMRGNIKSNLQYTNLNSIANIGTFGIKG
jgi:hypothetical protein